MCIFSHGELREEAKIQCAMNGDFGNDGMRV